MSVYPNLNEESWNNQGIPMSPQSYYENDYYRLQSQSLDFNPVETYGNPTYNDYSGVIFTPAPVVDGAFGTDEETEPPLLEELEIYPDRIFEKVLAVLNPFRSHGLTDDAEYLKRDSDLAGPIFFCILLAICMFLSGSRVAVGYIYGISVISCLLMYCLLSLMSRETGIYTLVNVASILGYCVLPIVCLAGLSIFVTLQGFTAFVLVTIVVLWSSASASRLFVGMSGDKGQQLLIAYPCTIVAGIFSLMVLF